MADGFPINPASTLTNATEIVATLRSHRFRLDNEKLLQAQIGETLTAAGFKVQREHRLGPGDVIDVLIDDVGIEIKIKGQRRAIDRQCARYCAHAAIAALVVVTNAAMGLPPDYAGKPVFVVSLGKAWLG